MVPSGAEPIFQLETTPHWTIDLTQIDPNLPPSSRSTAPAVVAAADFDLDLDGLNDLALVTPENPLCLFPGEDENVPRERPDVNSYPEAWMTGAGPQRLFHCTVQAPVTAWASTFEATVWHRPPAAGSVSPLPLAPPVEVTIQLPTSPGPAWSHAVNVPAPDPGPLEPGDHKTFFVQRRFLDSAGVRGAATTRVWTPFEQGGVGAITEEHGESYVWWGNGDIGGGTVGGPRVKPIGG